MYEQLFYDRLRCNSPEKVADLLQRALNTVREPISELRVLDLGAGNGMMGEVLKRSGVARLVGADIIPEARDAAYRDRSTVYDDYYVADLMNLEPDTLDWNSCIEELGLSGLPRELARNSAVAAFDGRRLELVVAPQFEKLAQRRHIDNLAAALGSARGSEVVVEVRVEAEVPGQGPDRRRPVPRAELHARGRARLEPDQLRVVDGRRSCEVGRGRGQEGRLRGGRGDVCCFRD